MEDNFFVGGVCSGTRPPPTGHNTRMRKETRATEEKLN